MILRKNSPTRLKNKQVPRQVLLAIALAGSGCAALFGWDIHAPGILSEKFVHDVAPLQQRIALYLDPSASNYISQNRGSRTADPQTYHVGESFAPMLVEAFQKGFGEFIFLEVEPNPDVMKQYGIPYLAAVRVKEFSNRVTWKGQALALVTETTVLDPSLQLVARFESEGVSDSQKVFAKKGGPEVNLNAALENNAAAIVHYLQDSLGRGEWR